MSECTMRHHGIDEVVRCAHFDGRYVAFGKSAWFETVRPGWYVITSSLGNGGSVSHPVQKTEADSVFQHEQDLLFFPQPCYME